MPKFEIVSIEEALEVTKNDRWLTDEFGEEMELPQCPECTGTNLNEDGTMCWDCLASDYLEVTKLDNDPYVEEGNKR